MVALAAIRGFAMLMISSVSSALSRFGIFMTLGGKSADLSGATTGVYLLLVVCV
jgi:hypothetical protein